MLRRRTFIGACAAAVFGFFIPKSEASEPKPVLAELRIRRQIRRIFFVRNGEPARGQTWESDVRMKNLTPGCLFYYVDDPDLLWEAISDPYQVGKSGRKDITLVERSRDDNWGIKARPYSRKTANGWEMYAESDWPAAFGGRVRVCELGNNEKE